MFDIEESDYCNLDFVEVRLDGPAGQVLGRFCGDSLPTNMTTGNVLWVKFRSSTQTRGRGFMAEYTLCESMQSKLQRNTPLLVLGGLQ